MGISKRLLLRLDINKALVFIDIRVFATPRSKSHKANNIQKLIIKYVHNILYLELRLNI